MAWPYADYEWWVYSAYQTVPDPVNVLGAWRRLSRGGYDLGAVSDLSTLVARWLARQHTLHPNQVQLSLFYARAFKKWKIADPASRKLRFDAAMEGFIKRNSVARDRGPCIEYPYREFMREYLNRALPNVLGEGWVGGNFGNGAVAEKWSHVRRIERLGAWVATDFSQGFISSANPDLSRDQAHDSSRLWAVPKDFGKDRLITVEPCWRSFQQQYVRSVLLESVHRGTLRGTAMDLEYTDGQSIQRELALRASRTCTLATLDLKDASDNIHVDEVYDVFPPWTWGLLDESRSNRILDPRNGTLHDLYIYAGMGNATTFIVETLFFSAYVYAFARAHGLPTYVSTFGDDVICHSKTAASLIEYGQTPYFVINKAKSFVGRDQIRESCGIFAYKGVDVTVPHIDGFPDTQSGRLGVVDLHSRCERSPLFWGLASAIANEGILPNWPFRVRGFASISDPTVPYDELPPMRLNRDIQVMEVKLPNLEPPRVTISITKLTKSHRKCDWDLARGLVAGSLLGFVHTGDRHRGNNNTVSFIAPGAWKPRKRWLCVEPDGYTDCSSTHPWGGHLVGLKEPRPR